ncbi:ABC transporter substrate-binding protein [Roseomonas acroporae]|uniref:ABC transporter substrate-binding protein n=1 Tax=Roseomonas acroporae TaxID=2937791 RepID=UPI0031F49DF1
MQGLQYLEGYYWDRDDPSRAFARRFGAEERGVMPGQIHAGCYSAALHYLRAVERIGSSDGLSAMRAMKAAPLDDCYAPGARIRKDGRLMNDMMLVRVKTPAESRGEWDLVAIERVVKAADIVRPMADGGCPFLDPRPG